MADSLRVVGLGAGGHAAGVLEILQSTPGIEVIGLLDPAPGVTGTVVQGVAVLGDDGLLPTLRARGVSAVFVGVGSVLDTTIRKRLFDAALANDLTVIDAIHPSAIVSRSATIGRGVTLMAGAIVNARARIGENVLVNTGAIVEHDVVIGDHVHVASGARIGGGVIIEPNVHVGLGAVVRQGLRIGSGAVVGAGAVVVADVEPQIVVAGVPARLLRRLRPASS